MSYNKHTWVARLGVGLNKFRNDGTATNLILTSTPDSVQQQGTPFSASWMNEMETGIDKAYTLTFSNISVPSNAWQSNSTYTDFPYKADISLTGVTADMLPEVTFNVQQAMSGAFAPVCQAFAGYVRIWATASQSAFTIPTIALREVRTN